MIVIKSACTIYHYDYADSLKIIELVKKNKVADSKIIDLRHDTIFNKITEGEKTQRWEWYMNNVETFKCMDYLVN